MRAEIRAGLASKLDAKLVDELLEAHSEAKRNFYLGGIRLQEVEAGRFSEAALRLLEETAWGMFTPIGKPLDSERVMLNLGNLPFGSQPDSVRLHIPRALRLVYDVRNKRDAAHLADGIDPNLQDASMVAAVLDWVLAEFVRLFHGVGADKAQRLVQGVVARTAPVVQDFKGVLKVLKPILRASEYCLVLLYQRGEAGATIGELRSWVRPSMRGNLNRTLQRLVDDASHAHYDGARYYITRTGEMYVEEGGSVDLIS